MKKCLLFIAFLTLNLNIAISQEIQIYLYSGLFGTVPLGGSVSNFFSVTNTGTKPMVVDSIKIIYHFPQDFSLGLLTPMIVNPNDLPAVWVTFSPSFGSGNVSAQINIYSNALNHPLLSFPVPAVIKSDVVPTNEWVSFWGDSTTLDGQSVVPGDVIDAFDPQGVHCGTFTVTSTGSYGLMSVYRNDLTTSSIDEGASPGDSIRFTVNGHHASPRGPDSPNWTSNGAVLKINLQGSNLLPPTLVSPAIGSTGVSVSPTLTWNSSTGATSYRLQISTDTKFATTKYDTSGITTTSNALSRLANLTKYYWRVNATNAGGSSDWSDIWSFTTIVATPPVLSASTTFLTFANRAKGDSATMTTYLRNTSISAMTISSITTNTSTFTATSGSIAVAGGDSTMLTVKFKPTSFGTFTDTVIVVSDGGTARIVLSGISPYPVLTSLKTSIVYGNVAKNTTKKDTIKVVNSSINTLTVDLIYTKMSAFAVDRISATVGTDTLKVVVSFMPTTIASYTDTVYLRNNSTTPLVKIPLSGSSPTPTILCNPRTIAFGDVGIYDSAKTILKVANSSVNILTIDSIYTHSMVFTSSPSFNQVTNKDTATITVQFKPVKFGLFSDTLFLRNNSDTTLFTIPLSGNTPASSISITPSGIAFGTVQKDTTRQLLFTITDSSISVLQIDSFWTQTKYFNVTHMLAFSQIRKGDTTRVTIRFTPDSARSYIDTMFIANNSPLSPFKVPLSGNGTITGVERMQKEIPTVFSLAQNYPNPFNPSTTIQYGLPVRSTVRLVIYNIIGQVVKELLNTEQQAGYQSVVWNATVASGLYFYRLEAVSLGDPSKRFVETKKMILLR